jgi:predicted nucleotidyltransferase
MKHPSLRVADILHMNLAVRLDLLNFVNGIRGLCPMPEQVVDVQPVGSYIRGNAKLSSDFDVNISYRDFNTQIVAHRMFHQKDSIYAGKMVGYLKQYEGKRGMHIDCGIVDCESEKYNLFASCNDMKLYHRLDDIEPQEWENGFAGAHADFPLGETIDLATYNYYTDTERRQEQFPKNFKLRYDTMSWRWMKAVRCPKRHEPVAEKWPDDVVKWQGIYGDKFQEYVVMTDPKRDPPTYLCPKS